MGEAGEISIGECIAAGTSNGSMLVWELDGSQQTAAMTPMSHTLANCKACVEVGESPVRAIQWIDVRAGSNGHSAFLATSAGQTMLMTLRGIEDRIELETFRVCADVLRGHRSLCLLGAGPRGDGSEGLEDSSRPTFAVVTSCGGLALTELDTSLLLRFQRTHMHARPDKITYHSNSQTLVVSVILPSGHTALRFYDASPDSSMPQMREQVLMQRDQRLSVLECIEIGGRQMVVAVAFVPLAGEDDGGDSLVAATRGEGTIPQSTLSLTLLMRKMVRGVETATTIVKKTEPKRKSKLVLRPIHNMDFDGRCAAVCTVGKGALALAVDDRILIVQPQRSPPERTVPRRRPELKHKQDGRSRTWGGTGGPTPLQVIAGASTPGGGAILSMSALSGNRLLVSEFMAATSLFTFYPEDAKLRYSGGEEKQGKEIESSDLSLRRQRLCRIAYTANEPWCSAGGGAGHMGRDALGERKEVSTKHEQGAEAIYGDGSELEEENRATTTFLGDWATYSLVQVHHTPVRVTAAEKRRQQALYIKEHHAELLSSSTICQFHSPVICIDEGSFQPVGSTSAKDVRNVLVVTRGGTVVEVSQRQGTSMPVCRTVL